MTLCGPRIRNSGDSLRGEGGPPRVQITWVPGSIRPYASLWITVQRLLVLNRLSAADFRRTFVRNSAGGAAHLSLDPLTADRLADPVSLLPLSRVLREPIGCFFGSQVSQYPLQARPSFSERLVWCWQCLREGFHSVLFALQGLERCPLHGVALEPVLPCGHPVALGSIGCVLRHPGQCVHGVTKCSCRRRRLGRLAGTMDATCACASSRSGCSRSASVHGLTFLGPCRRRTNVSASRSRAGGNRCGTCRLLHGGMVRLRRRMDFGVPGGVRFIATGGLFPRRIPSRRRRRPPQKTRLSRPYAVTQCTMCWPTAAGG